MERVSVLPNATHKCPNQGLNPAAFGAKAHVHSPYNTAPYKVRLVGRGIWALAPKGLEI